MAERLRAADMSYLAQESASTPMHVATLEIFEPPGDGFDYENLIALISDRIAFVPRYRQRLLPVPGGLSNPVWVDDDDFDLTYHVRRSALPRPGSMGQLRDLVSRVMSRRLDRSRPLWEVYLVEGLEGGRFAVFSKAHQVLVDGVETLDLGQLILDDEAEPPESTRDEWVPRRRPGSLSLVAEAVAHSVRHPAQVVDTMKGGMAAAQGGVLRVRGAAEAITGMVASSRGMADGPLTGTLSEQRRFTTVETGFDDYRRVRAVHGGTVNDAVLAVIAGGLRAWLLTRAESVRPTTRVKALVPMSVVNDEGEYTAVGSRVTPHLLSLPIGENSPVMRLHQVSYALKAHKETGRAVSASRLADIRGFAPTTLHALGARVAGKYPRRAFNLMVTNVPGPQFPLYALGAKMLASYPVLPLLQGQPLAIGVTSYDGHVFYGIEADRDAVPDVDVLAQCITEALAELVDTTTESRARAPRGRAKPAGARTGRATTRRPPTRNRPT
ncbi:MAG TPA: wax ester/triacylglycerol synthase family O-acyltransferase [Nocardioidaceae bacterium]|nr:wax ester/triacylglycerol synthase family O-acyltransferase [Nocardioidaceae bacterium]